MLSRLLAQRSLKVLSLPGKSLATPCGAMMTTLPPNSKLNDRQHNILSRMYSDAVETKNYSRQFLIERIFIVGMLPVFPMSAFLQNSFADYALATVVSVHAFWGMEIIMEDYARPFVLGDTLTRLCSWLVYLLGAIMFASLLHFNYNDVGITKAFRMIWSL